MSIDVEEIVRFLENLHPFRRLNEAQVRDISSLLKEVSLENGNSIYKQGDISQNLYIIFKGKIELTHWDDDEQESWGLLRKGDAFGFEAWDEGQTRLFSATAVEDTELLYLDIERFYILSEEIPEIRDYLELMQDGYEIMLGLNPDWRESNEPIHYISRVHQAILFGRLAIPVIIGMLVQFLLFYVYFLMQSSGWLLGAGIIIFLFMLGWLLWVFQDWTNDYFVLTDRRIINWNRVLLLYENRQEAPLDAILSVQVRTGSFFARRLSFGDVILRTFTGTIFMGRLPYPEQFASMIEERITRTQHDRLREEGLSRVNQVEQRLGLKPVVQVPEGPAVIQTTESSMPVSMLDWLSSKFQMRSEKGDVLTYRTHWYLLFKRTWFQSILLAGMLVILTNQLINNPLPLSNNYFYLLWVTLLLLICGWWFYGYQDWRNDCYIITDDQVIDVSKKPLSSEQKSTAALKNIQSVEYKRIGLTGLLLNYGTVYIRIGDEDFTFDNVYDPSEVQRELFNRIQKCKQKEKLADTESERQRILDWIEAYHRATENHLDNDRFKQ